MKKICLCCLLILAPIKSVFAESPEMKFAHEALTCASYYQISSHALSEMNVPQMKNIAERLKKAEKQAYQIALKYDKSADKNFSIVKQQQMNDMKNSTGLKELISKYRSTCMELVSDPNKRLEYWEIALM